MRGLLAFLAGVVALVAFAVALPSAWVAANVSSEDGYVAFTTSLLTDDASRQTIAGAGSEVLVDRANVPEALRGRVRQAFVDALDAAASREGLVKAWEQSQRQSHAAMFDDPRDLDAELDQSNRFVIDVGPLAQYAAQEINAETGVTLRAPDQLLLQVSGTDTRRTFEQVRESPDRAQKAGIVAAVAAVASLLLARRRGFALAWLGAGSVLVAGALRAVADWGTGKVLEQSTPGTQGAVRIQELLVDRVMDSIDVWLLWVAIVGGVVFLVGAVAALFRRSREATSA